MKINQTKFIGIWAVLTFITLFSVLSCKKENTTTPAPATSTAPIITTYHLTSVRQQDEAFTIDYNSTLHTISIPIISAYPDTLSDHFWNYHVNVLPLQVSGSFVPSTTDSTATLTISEYNLSMSTTVYPYISCTYHK